ncbi:MAG: ester cyclase [Azospirillaceae bacterium]|nr:ester cyclase [Azospirillaceae bacterium]
MRDHDQPPEILGIPAADAAAVTALYRAFNTGDTVLLDKVLAPDWQDIPLAPHQQPGRDGLKPLINEFRAAFPDMRIQVLEIIGVPGRAAIRAVITGTHTGAWFGVAPTGKPFRIPIHEFHHLQNGTVTHTWHLEDWFGWLFQVGAWPAVKQEITP